MTLVLENYGKCYDVICYAVIDRRGVLALELRGVMCVLCSVIMLLISSLHLAVNTLC
jgi:hypothetical protein